MKTEDSSYSEHLQGRSAVWWKRVLPVQYPYRAFIRRIFPSGKILDVGCGFGRLLSALPAGSVGVDHNADLIASGRSTGLEILSPQDFDLRYARMGRSFDGMLCAHVVEHMERPDAIEMLEAYVRVVRPGGKCLLITPQEKGFAADPTHVSVYGIKDLAELGKLVGLEILETKSFPLPAMFGSLFTYNENVVIGAVPSSCPQFL